MNNNVYVLVHLQGTRVTFTTVMSSIWFNSLTVFTISRPTIILSDWYEGRWRICHSRNLAHCLHIKSFWWVRKWWGRPRYWLGITCKGKRWRLDGLWIILLNHEINMLILTVRLDGAKMIHDTNLFRCSWTRNQNNSITPESKKPKYTSYDDENDYTASQGLDAAV
jgi:hypothetical protein